MVNPRVNASADRLLLSAEAAAARSQQALHYYQYYYDCPSGLDPVQMCGSPPLPPSPRAARSIPRWPATRCSAPCSCTSSRTAWRPGRVRGYRNCWVAGHGRGQAEQQQQKALGGSARAPPKWPADWAALGQCRV